MSEEVVCPRCAGPVWDNRTTKRNPKQPDYKCKDKDNCDGAIWLTPRGGIAKTPRPASQQTMNPVLRAPAPAMPVIINAPAFSIEAYIRVFRTVGRYFEALSQKEAWMEQFTMADVQAATATIIIQYSKLGIPLPERKSKAPVPTVRPEPTIIDSIEQQFEEEDGGLPFN